MRNKKTCVLFAVITAIAAAISGAAFFMKRHRRKSRMVAVALVAVFAFGMMGASTVFAKDFPTDEPNGAEYTEDTENTLNAGEEITIPALPTDPTTEQEDAETGETTEPVLTNPPQSLTPPGNMNLVDDFSGDSAADKQFITVVTRNGHFFYIVIDRAADRQNVHFLNQVDEYTLWAILEDEARPRPTPAPIEPMPEVVPTPEPEEEPIAEESGGGMGGLLVMILLIGAIGGGAYYYFKILKPQQATKTATPAEIDEFVFDDDEEDYSGSMEYGGADSSTADEDDMPDFTTTDPESEGE